MKAVALAVHHAQQQKVTQTGLVIAKRQKSVKLLGWLKWMEAKVRLGHCYLQYRIRGRNFTSKYCPMCFAINIVVSACSSSAKVLMSYSQNTPGKYLYILFKHNAQIKLYL